MHEEVNKLAIPALPTILGDPEAFNKRLEDAAKAFLNTPTAPNLTPTTQTVGDCRCGGAITKITTPKLGEPIHPHWIGPQHRPVNVSVKISCAKCGLLYNPDHYK